MKRIVKILTLTLFLVSPGMLHAQRVSFSSNVLEWADFGTANFGAGLAVGQHFSLQADVRYNNWTFRKGNPEDRFNDPVGEDEKQFENRKQAYALGIRYWPWYVFSGWWFQLRGQYMEYNYGGIFRHDAQEGDAYGAGLAAGYTFLLAKNLNAEFGLGGWAGARTYRTYRCTNCGSVTETVDRPQFFLLPDDVWLSLVFIF